MPTPNATTLSGNSSQILTYLANQDPILREVIQLPVQGEDVPKIGKLIMSNNRYKNAFINAINVIALTLVVDDVWQNPWEAFTDQGQIRYGQSVREMILDLVEAQDYMEHMNNATDFLNTEVPNVLNYMHEINYQKFYKMTINDQELSLAFYDENTLYDFIMACYNTLRKSYIYDRYIVDKYQLQRRIVDGTITCHRIETWDTNTPRENVSAIKEVSNDLIFMSPKFNPAGLRIGTPFSKQRAIITTGLEAKLSTEVLATSFFKDEAEMRSKMSLVDGFGYNDWDRLEHLLGNGYVEFSETEKSILADVKCVIIADNFFKDYYYALDSDGDTKNAEFTNPETLMRNVWLHTWRIFSTSPFANAVVFNTIESGIRGVTVSPSTATVTKGQNLTLTANVNTKGIVNKAVTWSVDDTAKADGVTINQEGILRVPASATVTTITVTATSVWNPSKSGTATITTA